MKEQDLITPIDQYLIDFVRNLRHSLALTQADIANILGISKQYVSDVESTNSRAKYNVRHINILADHFNISPREFFPEKALSLEFARKEKSENVKGKKAKKEVLKLGRPKKAGDAKKKTSRKK